MVIKIGIPNFVVIIAEHITTDMASEKGQRHAQFVTLPTLGALNFALMLASKRIIDKNYNLKMVR